MDFPSSYYCFLGKVDKLLLFRLSNPTGQELGVCSLVIVSTSARSGLVMSASVSLTGRFLAVIQPVTAEPEHTSMTHLPITPSPVSVFSSAWVCGSHLFYTYNPQSTTAKRRFCRRHNTKRLHRSDNGHNGNHGNAIGKHIGKCFSIKLVAKLRANCLLLWQQKEF